MKILKHILVPDYGKIIGNPANPEEKSMTPELIVTLNFNTGNQFKRKVCPGMNSFKYY